MEMRQPTGERMAITVDTLVEIKRDKIKKFSLTFLERVVLSPSLYMLTQLFSSIDE